jgi:hypothetical protein
MFAAVSFMAYLPREEVIAALEHRTAQIEAAGRGLAYKECSRERARSTPGATSRDPTASDER